MENDIRHPIRIPKYNDNEKYYPRELAETDDILYRINEDGSKTPLNGLTIVDDGAGNVSIVPASGEPVAKDFWTDEGKIIVNTAIAKEAEERQKEIAVERARIDQFTALEEGSTTGDAELIDIRVGADGVNYPTAGDAVREQVGKLVVSVDNLAQYHRIDDSTEYNRLISHVINDGYYNIVTSRWDDVPNTSTEGFVLLVFRFSPNYIIQIAADQYSGEIYTRKVHRTTYEVERDWESNADALNETVASLAQYRGLLDSAEYDRLTSHIVESGYYNIRTADWDDVPAGSSGGYVLLVFKYSPNYVIQIATAQTGGDTFTRVVHDTTFEIFRDWASTSNSLEKDVRAIEEQLDVLAQYHRVYDSAEYDRLTSHIVENGYYNIVTAQWDDVPNPSVAGFVLLVYKYSPNYVIQIAIDQTGGNMFTRVVHDTTFEIFRDWSSVSNSLENEVKTLEEKVNAIAHYAILDSANFDRLTSHVVNDGYYSITTSQWDDLPLNNGCVLLVFRYSPNYVVQIAIQQITGITITRIVHRTTYAIYRDWATSEGNAPLNVLAIGDSICAGVRNGRKGFVGDLGYPYKNAGVSSATISNKNASVTNIPNQLVGVTGFTPDVIISNGGVNDYYYGATMGDIPTEPVTNDEMAESLNRDTVTGALQYLFYKMITLYPKAQRYFLLTHKTTGKLNGTWCDYTVTKNSAGYTQTELYDTIKKVCAIYGVQVIDIFGESMINTAFGVYKSSVAYTDDNSVTNSEFVDSDGVHPLAYGYLHAYVPIIRKALATGTHK